MKFNNTKELKKLGFVGFKTISDLKLDITNIPSKKGIYVVYYDFKIKPTFNKNGFYEPKKGKTAIVPVNVLVESWVDKANVIYIGKAGGTNMKASLQSRLKQYMKFGDKKKVSHWGGRFIWHLDNCNSLLVAWKVLTKKGEEPRIEEGKMIKLFEDRFNKIPFANRAH